MTKEELKKEANKYAKGITEKYVFMEHGRASALGYLAGAEPREKRIAELEAQIEKMKWHDLRTDPNDLPKDRHNVWIVYLNGYYQEERSVASYRHKFWVIGGLKTECEVIAWCELPKWEIKEND